LEAKLPKLTPVAENENDPIQTLWYMGAGKRKKRHVIEAI
jgi:hypothetical protein